MIGPIISDNHRAGLCKLSYDPGRPPAFALGSQSLPRIFLDRDADGGLVATCEGTRPSFLGDWRADFDQIDLTIDPTQDPVPHGWGSLMLGVIFRLLAQIPPDTALGWNGHSMGGSDALIGAWLWKLAGRKLARVTAFEPGPVGPLSGALRHERVLITWIGDPKSGDIFARDPVPESTPRGHPYDISWLPRLPSWSAFDCHEISNVTTSLAMTLKGV